MAVSGGFVKGDDAMGERRSDSVMSEMGIAVCALWESGRTQYTCGLV